MDPRAIVSYAQLDDNGGVGRIGIFQNSATFLNNTTWFPSPLNWSAITAATTPSCNPVNIQDFEAFYLAQNWTYAHGIISTNNANLPASVTKIVFLKAGNRYMTILYLDWAGGVSSTDIQLSLRDNSTVGGNLINSASTVPVIGWSGNTFSGTSRKLIISTIGPGRVNMVLRVIDNTAKWSMFEMDWNIVP